MIDILTILSTMPHGSEEMAENDPHGLTLVFVCLTVVFSVQLILFLIYTIFGRASSGWFLRLIFFWRKDVRLSGDEVSGEVEAAIATAIHLYLNDNEKHDDNNNVLTIRQSESAWADKTLTFRKQAR